VAAEGGREPGDVAPRERTRTLERPPGDRYVAAPGAPPVPPRIGRGILVGTVAAVALALLWVLPATFLDFSAGLLIVAGVFGWLIGLAVRTGAWPTRPSARAASGTLAGAAGALGAACWVLCWSLDYLVSLAIRPASALTLGERIASEPFVAWLVPQLDPLSLGQLVLMAVIASRAAR
jgi:hypothetical protein